MVQTCSKCSRANPADAVYCYYDGLVLGGHSAQRRPRRRRRPGVRQPVRLPHRQDLPQLQRAGPGLPGRLERRPRPAKQGYLETFLGGLGRIDLVMAAKEAAKFPDRDRGLDQFLSKLPSDVLDAPRLAVETQEINLGVLPVGDEGREFELHLENQGMRLLYGSVTCTDGLWLTLRRRPRRDGKALPVRPRSGAARSASSATGCGPATSRWRPTWSSRPTAARPR